MIHSPTAPTSSPRPASIVLIDRPDLHLAADDQARFLRALASLGEDNQIIAATSSEALVAAMEAPAVVRLP